MRCMNCCSRAMGENDEHKCRGHLHLCKEHHLEADDVRHAGLTPADVDFTLANNVQYSAINAIHTHAETHDVCVQRLRIIFQQVNPDEQERERIFAELFKAKEYLVSLGWVRPCTDDD